VKLKLVLFVKFGSDGIAVSTILQLDLVTELTGWHFLYIIAKTKSARS
jgi:hypothetical protein